MLICELDNIVGTLKVPTRESIEHDRKRQLEAVKALQRRLRDVLTTR